MMIWMTWKRFKDVVEENGVTDEMMIEFIDWNGYDEIDILIDNPNQTFSIT